MTFRLSVPGNLLLAGEYAVLEEGGLGIALAVEPRLTVTVTPAERWSIEGHWGGRIETWSLGQEPVPFAGKILLKALEWGGTVPPARIVVDSSAFFDASGRKLGFGSSAALAAGLTAAVGRLAGRELGHAAAVETHRHAQGGAGSGYDVTASWFGGCGLFTGGKIPKWQPLERPPTVMAVFSGPEAVRTTGSIALYRAWQAGHPDEAERWLNDSNDAVRTLAGAVGTAWWQAAERCRHLGLAVGRQVGSPAELPRPEALSSDVFIKALGAGNETGLAVSSAPLTSPGLTPLTIAEGLRWE
jgi:phosphomevalonate kinase